ncbi:MaoC/PaaZ C-terminal domain-containing protein [Kitasatospora sp. NPDC002040]|uniref:MaoC/PaaZ C-terminal domain-containing protein n=1 Tax=Kitasatospora sp. NPDC002040 TaxID=3154661 RepID=UPI00332B5929
MDRVLGSYLRAVTRRGVSGGGLPERRLLLPERAADPGRLADYRRICGFPAVTAVTAAPADGPLPPTYPHLLAFPAALRLMTAPGFPLPLLGLVHIANTVGIRRPVAAREPLAVEVWTEGLREHPRGTAFEVVAVARAAGEEVWVSRSTYLHRSRPGGPPVPVAAGVEPLPGPFESWPLTGATGRRYAAVSGDRNPIHLSALTARPFGFRRAIAHGMWTKARALAALGDRLPPAAEIEVAFRAPVPLPGTVRFAAAERDGRTELLLTDRAGTRTHLRGSVTARQLP